MKASVTYSVVKRKNPSNPLAAPRYYAQAQARGEADIRTISDRIQVMCTVTRADVVAVLTALETCVSDSLSNGEIVRLGELGSLQMSLSSKGADTKEEFNSSLIDKSHILFRPGLTLTEMQRTLRFERVAQRIKKANPEEGSDENPKDPSEGDAGSADHSKDPGDVSQDPGKADQDPGKVDQDPGKADQDSGKAEQDPGKVDQEKVKKILEQKR